MRDPVTKTIIVKGSVEKVFEAWADFENFPKFMQYIESVTKTGPDTSHWVMQGPMGRTIEWDARITRLERNKRIAWHSTQGDIKTSGQVTFMALPQGETQVTVTLLYVLTSGALRGAMAGLVDDPAGKLMTDLRNFKRHVDALRGREA